MCLRTTLLFIALAAGLAGATYAQTPVGARTITADDLPGEPRLSLTVWYPATERGVTEDGAPTAAAVLPLAERRRLILLSHGSGGFPLNQRDLILHLVSSGSIVAAPLHPYDNSTDRSGPGTDLQLLGRPRHLARSLDALLAHPIFGGMIEPTRVGIIGYSAGGYAALVVAGGRPNFALGPEHCAQTVRDRLFCSWMRRGGIQRLRRGWTVTHDARVRAAVLLAPAYGVFFDRKGLADVRIPVRLYRAESDEMVSHPYNEDHLRRTLPLPPEYVVVPGGHSIFISPCRGAALSILCQESARVDRASVTRRLNGEIHDFFDRTLGKD